MSRDRIVDAALALIDARGHEAFSMRKLGAELDCEAMALYNHFANKNFLLDAVVDRMLKKVVVPPRDFGDWLDRTRAYSQSFHALVRIHPGAFPLFAMRRFHEAHGLALLDEAFATILDEGIDPRVAVRLYRTLANFLAGTGLNELMLLSDAQQGSASHEEGELQKHPAIAAVAPYLGPAYFDEVFEQGLDIILRGFEEAGAGTHTKNSKKVSGPAK
ncbi:MAG: TetR/AcrR family transcriptional regulator C-terminal domain-containing protein [Polyangiaceae bacterium]